MDIIDIFNNLDDLLYFNKSVNSIDYFIIGYDNDVQILKVHSLTHRYSRIEWIDLVEHNAFIIKKGFSRYNLTYTDYPIEYCALCGMNEACFIQFEAGVCEDCKQDYDEGNFIEINNAPSSLKKYDSNPIGSSIYTKKKMYIWYMNMEEEKEDTDDNYEYDLFILSQEELINDVGFGDILICELLLRKLNNKLAIFWKADMIKDVILVISNKLIDMTY